MNPDPGLAVPVMEIGMSRLAEIRNKHMYRLRTRGLVVN